MAMREVLRVVAIRRGKTRPTEFRLRPGERGLSLFALVDDPGPDEVIDAVRSAGKQGELAVAVFEVAQLRRLGLVLRRTEGGTPDPAVNAIHIEARLPWWRESLMWLTRRSIHEEFNERFSERLYELASVLE